MSTPNALEYRTLNDIFFKAVGYDAPDLIRVQKPGNAWELLSGRAVYARVRAFAGALHAMGLRKGDRVLLVSENRWEWAVADFATLAMGIVNVPLFPTLKAAQMEQLVAHSGARVAVVSTAGQLQKLNAIRANTSLEHIIVMDDAAAGDDALGFTALLAGAPEGRDAAFDAMAQAIAPRDLASIIYTSGTTGEPKGVMLTHGNIASNVSYSLRGFRFQGPQRTVSFLPLSHVTARHADYALYSLGFSLAYCPALEKLMGAMQAVKPTLLVAVPRVYEKVRQEVERRSRGSKLKSAIVQWALGVGARHEQTLAAGKTPASPLWRLADKLFYSKVKAVFGGETVYYIAGGAPLGIETARWYLHAGIRVLEGYGLTETSPVIGVNDTNGYRMGSIGKPLPNLQVRLAEDGELLVKGPNVFSGYWESPKLTAEAFDAEGWFLTGDIARLDDEGFLFITDRKKELIKTSAGKFIAPQPIEGRLKNDVFIAEAALVGDREKYVAALLAPNFAMLEPWARAQKIPFRSRRELVEHQGVIDRYKETIKQVNKGLADFEIIKKFQLVADEWTIETGEVTPSMKLKRRVLAERYKQEIESLFR